MNDIQFFSNYKVLITGASGFIGSHLTEALVRAGADVRATVHYNSRNSWGNLELLPPDILSQIEVVTGDIRDGDFVRSAVKGRDTVFHLAALIAIPYSYVSPEAYVATNVSGTLNVLQAARDFDVARVVHTSTSEVYGTALYAPIDEKHPLQGQSPYSATKIGADKLAESFYLSFETPVVTVRPFNTYGPRQSARAVIPAITIQALASPDKVRLGSLSPVRDLNFASDTARGFIMAAQSPNVLGEVVNLGSGRGVTIGEVAEIIFEILGVSPIIETDEARVRPEGSEVMKLIAGADRARDLMGWESTVSLEDGLRQTVEWIRANQNIFKSGIYNV